MDVSGLWSLISSLINKPLVSSEGLTWGSARRGLFLRSVTWLLSGFYSLCVDVSIRLLTTRQLASSDQVSKKVREYEQDGSLCNLLLEGTSHHLCCSLFIRSELLGPHTQRAQMTQGCQYWEMRTIVSISEVPTAKIILSSIIVTRKALDIRCMLALMTDRLLQKEEVLISSFITIDWLSAPIRDLKWRPHLLCIYSIPPV